MNETTAVDTTTNQSGEVVLDVKNLVVEFKSGRQRVQAVSGVTFQVREGETLGLVGESGCGKSTTGRTLVQVQAATSGEVIYQGQDLNGMKGKQLRQLRNKIQMIFQDPISSLNPRRRIKDIVAEPLVIWNRGTKEERAAKVRAMLEAVGIDPDAAGDRRPGEFSGGQCQRISIARALASEPEFLVADEPTSALDVSVQAQILNLMRDLQQRLGLTYLFISHNLAVVRHMSDLLGVMYLGRIVEIGPGEDVFRRPLHPYTRLLLDAIPDLSMTGKVRTAVGGEVPSPINPPPGCPFHPRCPLARDRCRVERPGYTQVGQVAVACHAVEEGWE